MKRFLRLLLTLAALTAFAAPQRGPGTQHIATADSIDGVYIPRDISECMTELDKVLSDSLKEVIRGMERGEFTITAHMGLGMWIRNNFALWAGSRLALHLMECEKAIEPDGMSDYILAAYYDHLQRSDEND